MNSPSAEPVFAANLDAFITRIDSLAEHLTLTMGAVQVVTGQLSKQLKEFVTEHGDPLEGEPGRFLIPENHFPKFQRLDKRLTRTRIAHSAIPRSFTVTLISDFDAFLGGLLRVLYVTKPEALNVSQRTFTYAQLADFGSIEAARDYLLEKEVETFLRASHIEQFEVLEDKFGLPLRKNLGV